MPNDILSPEDATFETSVGHWVPLLPIITGTTIARVTTPTPHAGSGVLAITGNGPIVSLDHTYIEAIPDGSLVTATVWARQSASNPSSAWTFRWSANYVSVDADPVSDSAWQKLRITYPLGTGGADLAGELFFGAGGFSGGGTGYISDVHVSHEPINPPSALTATRRPTTVDLAWTDGADQDVGTEGGDAGSPPIDGLSVHEAIAIERSINGGAYSQIHLGLRTPAAHTDTVTLSPGDVYTYRVRYRVFYFSVFVYSAYSNVVTVRGTGLPLRQFQRADALGGAPRVVSHAPRLPGPNQYR